MFQLTPEEKKQLVPIWHHFKTRKHTYSLPYAFTEHGITMLSAVLTSERAITMSIIVVKTFIRLKTIIANHQELTEKLKELEQKVNSHDKDIILSPPLVGRAREGEIPNLTKKVTTLKTLKTATSPA
jgi:hypothetical protein